VDDMNVTIALCDACPSSEVDELTISLLNIFDSRGLGFVLLQALIEHEVDETGMLLTCSASQATVIMSS
jgi:neurofibromin 1